MTILVAVPQPAASAAGEGARPVADLDGLTLLLQRDHLPVTVVIGPEVDLDRALALTRDLRLARPEVGFVLLRDAIDATLLQNALRAGIREVVTTDDSVALADAVKRSDELNTAMAERTHAPGEDESRLGRVVTVFSAKGGCGKTTISTNLAAALADGGRRNVVIVDLDLAFGDVAIALQLFPSRTIADAVPMGEADIDFDGVQSLLTAHSPGLTSLVAPVEPGAADTIPASLVGRVLELLREHFDYVVVDTPPAFDDQVLAAFDTSDAIVLLATLDIPALKNLKLTLETLDLLNYPRDRWRIVLNRADSKVGLATSEVEKTLRTAITAQVPSSREVPATINRGVPIVLDDAKHPVSVAIRTFAERDIVGTLTPLAKQEKVPAPLRNDRRGFLRRRARA